MNRQDNTFRNISRIDQPDKNTFGWFVRIRRDGNRVNKFFSDWKYGGRDQALQQARSFRDNNLQHWSRFARNHNRAMHNGKKSNIGYPGISYCVKSKLRNGEEYKEHVFQVSYTPEKGLHKNKSFYIPKSSNKAQFRKNYNKKLREAIRFRDQQMLRIYGARYVNYKKQQR